MEGNNQTGFIEPKNRPKDDSSQVSSWLIRREFMYLFALPSYIVGSAGRSNEQSKKLIERSIITNSIFWVAVVAAQMVTKKSVVKYAVYLYVGISMILVINQIRKVSPHQTNIG